MDRPVGRGRWLVLHLWAPRAPTPPSPTGDSRQISRDARRLVAPLPRPMAYYPSPLTRALTPPGRGAHPGCAQPVHCACRAAGVIRPRPAARHDSSLLPWARNHSMSCGWRPIFSSEIAGEIKLSRRAPFRRLSGRSTCVVARSCTVSRCVNLGVSFIFSRSIRYHGIEEYGV